jgi:hypothetical protein
MLYLKAKFRVFSSSGSLVIAVKRKTVCVCVCVCVCISLDRHVVILHYTETYVNKNSVFFEALLSHNISVALCHSHLGSTNGRHICVTDCKKSKRTKVG